MKPTLIRATRKQLQAEIILPASKSISNRACILRAVIAQQKGFHVEILNLSDADDTHIILEALLQHKGNIHIKNAGTCLRFLTAYFAASEGSDITLTGSERMQRRPIKPLVTALHIMGADITYLEREGHLPIHIKGGQLKGGEVEINSNESSQFVSALMMISPLLNQELNLKLIGKIVSKDYIRMTQHMLEEFGIHCFISEDFSSIQISNRISETVPASYTVESDWSSAAFAYEAVLLAEQAEIYLPGLFLQSIQGDRMITHLMESLGVISEQKEKGIVLHKQEVESLTQHEFNFSNFPDLAPPFICAAVGAGFPFKAIGLSSLIYKESNRMKALAEGLLKLGFKIETDEKDYFYYEGIAPTPSGHSKIIQEINTHEDHRIAMAFAILSLKQTELTLSETRSVIKSFPLFWEEAEKLGIYRVAM